ncbi:MAG: hypothetical protein APR54_05090 [Candidatus Cloacimonas sp. SDB]|nr:MAG: hypothetical protein APR54_05090 [Candidatus Cloacimonas sp. SDB]
MNLIYRILLGIIFIPVILLLFYLGGWYLIAFLTVVACVQSLELRKLFQLKQIQIPLVIVPLNLAFLYFLVWQKLDFALAVILLIQIILFCHELIKKRMNKIVKITSASLFLVLYSSFFISFVYYVRQLQNGRTLLICLMILIWITDTAAYFSGTYLGRKRNIIAASPKKSLEGFIGGIIAALGGAFICGTLWNLSISEILILGITAGIVGQFGDLMESLIKRDFGVKDSSSLLPGHGGMLDRFDSLTLAAPVFFVILKLFGIK